MTFISFYDILYIKGRNSFHNMASFTAPLSTKGGSTRRFSRFKESELLYNLTKEALRGRGVKQILTLGSFKEHRKNKMLGMVGLILVGMIAGYVLKDKIQACLQKLRDKVSSVIQKLKDLI